MPEVRVGDVRLHYETAGSGEPLLMVMGLGGSSAGWAPELVAELARFFRTIIYDNRGTGRSDKPDAPYSLEMFAADAIAILDDLKINRAHLFGVSMGGMIAQEIALRYGSRLQTLTLGCTTCGGKNAVPPPPESAKLLTAPRDGLSDAEVIRRGWPLAYTSEYIKDHRAELEASIPRLLANATPGFIFKRHMDATYRLKTYERLPEITLPTLVITGAKDVLMPARNSEILAERIPGAKLHIIPNAGHAFFNEARDEFLREFVPFAKSHPIGTAKL
ncbi:MAG: alpha/beta hydrolase [Acetobacteraceae bacterium]|nr:alpha/beta hydrolase [Deltaproteobacteria bacterium]MBV8589658.1 alpha/beta hydrolase [Acetobacteraceae bacterium]